MFLLVFIIIHFVALFLCALINWKIQNPFLRLPGGLIAWTTGMILAGQAEAARLLTNATPEDLTSEDFISSMPDGPNLTVSWIVSGWIPILIAFFIVSKSHKKKAKTRRT